jgi:hypothetical protein
MRNRYLLFLSSNYYSKKFVFELINTSDNPDYYKFRLDLPLDYGMPYGEYDYFLIRCELPYEVQFSQNLIDSKLTVTDFDGNASTFALRDLPCESGILRFEPDECDKRYEYIDIDNSRIVIDVDN